MKILLKNAYTFGFKTIFEHWIFLVAQFVLPSVAGLLYLGIAALFFMLNAYVGVAIGFVGLVALIGAIMLCEIAWIKIGLEAEKVRSVSIAYILSWSVFLYRVIVLYLELIRKFPTS